MKKVWLYFKKYWITIWLTVAIIGTVSFFAFAEYINVQNRAKRTVANTADTGKLFTSDYLKSGELIPREIAFGSNATECEIPIRIWNFDSSDPTKFYSASNIVYTVVAQVVDDNGNVITDSSKLSGIQLGIKKETETIFTYFSGTASTREIIVNENQDNEYKYSRTVSYDTTNGFCITYEGLQLMNDDKDENMYTLSYPIEMIKSDEKLYVKLTATPTPIAGNSFRDIDPLGAILSVTEQKPSLTQGWSGDFYDSASFTDYDGFNYVISGNGSTTIQFSWRTDKLDVNKYFLEEIAGDIASGYPKEEIIDGVTWETIYIIADSNDSATKTTVIVNGVSQEVPTRYGVSRYDVQMYMTGNPDSDYSDWETIKNYVRFDPNAVIPDAGD